MRFESKSMIGVPKTPIALLSIEPDDVPSELRQRIVPGAMPVGPLVSNALMAYTDEPPVAANTTPSVFPTPATTPPPLSVLPPLVMLMLSAYSGDAYSLPSSGGDCQTCPKLAATLEGVSVVSF